MQDRSDTPLTDYPTDWSTFARHVTAVVLLLGLVLASFLLRPVLQYIIFATIIVFILSYPVRVVEERTRLSYSSAAAIVYLLYLLAAVALFMYLMIPAIQGLIRLATQISQELPSFIDFLEKYTPEQGWLLDPQTGERLVNLDFILEPLSRYVRGEEAQEVGRAIDTLANLLPRLVGSVANFITGSIVVHILAFFFLLELPMIYAGLMGRIPAKHRPEYRILTGQILRVWVNFFRGTVVSSGLIGLLTFSQLLIMGIPGALTLSLLIFVTSLIPMVGGFISLPVLVFVTFTQGSTTLSLEPIPLTILVVAIHFIITQIVWQVIYPKLTGKALNLPVSVVIVGLAVGAAIGGFLGVLLAAPVLGSLRQIVEFLLRKIHGGNPYPEEPVPQLDM